MNNNISPLQFYSTKIQELNSQLNVLNNKRKTIAWIRSLIAFLTILFVYLLLNNGWPFIILIIIIGIALFLIAVSADLKNKSVIENTERLIKINKDEIKTLNHNFGFKETGKQFEPQQHSYANDLDIFGDASIYQYLNRCSSEQGKQLLAQQLLSPQTKAEIELQQESVKELLTKTNWNQQFISYGIANPVTETSQQKIENWLHEKQVFTSNYWQWIKIIFPIITISSLILYINGNINQTIFGLLVFIYFLFAFYLSKKITKVWLHLSKITSEIKTLATQLNWFEQDTFSSQKIIQLKNGLRSTNQESASASIHQLKKILDSLDVRLNVLLFFFLNTFLLWDLWQILALNKWQQKNNRNTNQWFKVIAEMELTVSLATLAFNEPDFDFPEIAEQHFTLNAVNIGHPLISKEKRIDNDYTIEGIGKISLITGSNMGGKSTFLRSVGVNIILALMGAPVCATRFKISPVKLMSSMRIADNLAESASTFYAELKKLETIIEAVNKHEQIFILLDEILRGTNSLDKHTGSEALIKQLIKQNAVAVLATHDVELTKLQINYPSSITNYHFDVQVSNDELYFDYKLKEGICKSLNASILMKKIGIEV